MAIGFKGTSISDIEQGAEDALEEDIANMSPDTGSTADKIETNLDAKVSNAGQGVDWPSKTFDIGGRTESSHAAETILNISGSGYLAAIISSADSDTWTVEIDGGTIYQISADTNGFALNFGNWRFDSSVKVASSGPKNDNRTALAVLD